MKKLACCVGIMFAIFDARAMNTSNPLKPIPASSRVPISSKKNVPHIKIPDLSLHRGNSLLPDSSLDGGQGNKSSSVSSRANSPSSSNPSPSSSALSSSRGNGGGIKKHFLFQPKGPVNVPPSAIGRSSVSSSVSSRANSPSSSNPSPSSSAINSPRPRVRVRRVTNSSVKDLPLLKNVGNSSPSPDDDIQVPQLSELPIIPNLPAQHSVDPDAGGQQSPRPSGNGHRKGFNFPHAPMPTSNLDFGSASVPIKATKKAAIDFNTETTRIDLLDIDGNVKRRAERMVKFDRPEGSKVKCVAHIAGSSCLTCGNASLKYSVHVGNKDGVTQSGGTISIREDVKDVTFLVQVKQEDVNRALPGTYSGNLTITFSEG